ncbi:MAG: hypothetical protein ABIJ21_09065 [Nanoarchaeota archaeon]
MGIRDYLIILALMFINLVTTAFLAFRSKLVNFELGIVIVLLILDLIFVLSQKPRLAIAFFTVSLINMLLLFFWQPDFIFALLAIIDILILYYLVLYRKTEAALSTEQIPEETEDLFAELGLPTIEQIAKNDISMIYPAQETSFTKIVSDDKITPTDVFVEKKPALQTYEEFEQAQTPPEDYVHIEELGLPEAEEKIPQRKYTYHLYYEEPRQDLSFQPIEVLEKKIEQKVKRIRKRTTGKKKKR